MEFRTKIDIEKAAFGITPTARMLFVGSCFAENIGRRFVENRFNAIVNPFGTMYNPASVLHTVEKIDTPTDYAIITLGTNHVYILKETGQIVDNCQKRPQSLFDEKELTVDECADYLKRIIATLRSRNENVKVILTVSPIRYAKYGYHKSQLSKGVLLLAIDNVVRGEKNADVTYFPAYEIVNDELRDYRFYASDMLHPSEQAVEYIYERFDEVFFTDETRQFVAEWQPIKAALAHRPFNPESPDYKAFLAKAKENEQQFIAKWGVNNEETK